MWLVPQALGDCVRYSHRGTELRLAGSLDSGLPPWCSQLFSQSGWLAGWLANNIRATSTRAREHSNSSPTAYISKLAPRTGKFELVASGRLACKNNHLWQAFNLMPAAGSKFIATSGEVDSHWWLAGSCPGHRLCQTHCEHGIQMTFVVLGKFFLLLGTRQRGKGAKGSDKADKRFPSRFRSRSPTGPTPPRRAN